MSRLDRIRARRDDRGDLWLDGFDPRIPLDARLSDEAAEGVAEQIRAALRGAEVDGRLRKEAEIRRVLGIP